jgi:hypothetical protein
MICNCCILFKLRKNKSFSYTPRFSKDTEIHSDEKKTSKYGDFSSKWRKNQGLSNRKLNKGMSLPLLILVLALILICMYVLDIKFK